MLFVDICFHLSFIIFGVDWKIFPVDYLIGLLACSFYCCAKTILDMPHIMCRTDDAYWKLNSYVIFNNLEANVHVKVMNSFLFWVSSAYFLFHGSFVLLSSCCFNRKYGLDDNTVDFIGHAIALHRDDSYLEEPALDTVKRMKVNIWS